jgi:hypothetical protein
LSPEPAPISYGQLLSELGALCSAKRTGTLFIATTDNQSARIGLRQGEIVSLGFRTQRGLEALDQIRKITAGRFSFSDTVVDRVLSADLPDTSDLLEMLSGGDSPPPPPAIPAAALAATSRAVGPVPSHAVAPAAAPPVAQLVKAQAVIEAELTEFVGPIAPLLCREHVARAAAAGPPWDLPALVEAVSHEIGDRAKEDRFKQKTLARLRDR